MSTKSIENFILVVNSGIGLKDRHVIYKVIAENQPIALRGLRMKLPRFPHQTLTARLSELCDCGYIYEDSNGFFRATKLSEVEEKKQNREQYRYEKWKALGLKNGWRL